MKIIFDTNALLQHKCHRNSFLLAVFLNGEIVVSRVNTFAASSPRLPSQLDINASKINRFS